MRVKKDGCIWLSIGFPWGMEILRCMITPQGVTLIDHQKKAYYVYDYAILNKRWPGPWDYALLQALLLGELVYAPATYTLIQQNGQQAIIQHSKEGWSLTYFINPTHKKVEKLVAKATSGNCGFTVSYKPRQHDQTSFLFKQAILHWHCNTVPRQPNINMTIKGVKAKCSDKPLHFPFVIPACYEQK